VFRGLNKICIVTVSIILLIGPALIPSNSLLIDNTNETQNQEFVSSQWTPDEPITDPYLVTKPLVVVNGTSEEFTSSYFSGGGEIYSCMNLTWTHLAGTELSFPRTFANTINSNDFIYISLPFEYEDSWEAAISVDCRIETTGDFSAPHEVFSPMFETFIAFITPSDIVYKFNSIYSISEDYFYPTTEYSEHGITLDRTTCNRLNRGGYTQLNLAIGLSPTKYFQEFNDGGTIIHPWTFYNGSITFSIRAVHLGTFVDSYDSENTPPPPLIGISRERTFNASPDDVAVAPDGFVYTLVTEGKYDTHTAQLVLIKWDSYAKPVWSRRIESEEAIGGISLAIPGDGFIYTLGVFRDVWSNTDESEFLTKWDYAGNLIWQRDVTSAIDYVRDMAIDNQSNIYIIGYAGSWDDVDAFMVKYNSECEHQWTMSWLTSPSYLLDLAIDTQDNIYVTGRTDYSDYFLSKWDSNANHLWTINSHFTKLDIGNDGYLYGAVSYNNGFLVSKMDLSGNEIWNATWGRYYRAARLYNTYLCDFAVGSNGSVFVTATAFIPHNVPFVVNFNTNGDYQWNSTWNLGDLGEGRWYLSSNHRNSIVMCGNNLAYVAGIASIEFNSYASLVVIGDDVPLPPSDFLDIGLLGTGMIGVSIVLVIVYRKRQAKAGLT